jgi:hypothetical protein
MYGGRNIMLDWHLAYFIRISGLVLLVYPCPHECVCPLTTVERVGGFYLKRNMNSTQLQATQASYFTISCLK